MLDSKPIRYPSIKSHHSLSKIVCTIFVSSPYTRQSDTKSAYWHARTRFSLAWEQISVRFSQRHSNMHTWTFYMFVITTMKYHAQRNCCLPQCNRNLALRVARLYNYGSGLLMSTRRHGHFLKSTCDKGSYRHDRRARIYFIARAHVVKQLKYSVEGEETKEACRGVGRGGSEGSDDPPFLGANFIHFLYKVLVKRSMQK